MPTRQQRRLLGSITAVIVPFCSASCDREASHHGSQGEARASDSAPSPPSIHRDFTDPVEVVLARHTESVRSYIGRLEDPLAREVMTRNTTDSIASLKGTDAEAELFVSFLEGGTWIERLDPETGELDDCGYAAVTALNTTTRTLWVATSTVSAEMRERACRAVLVSGETPNPMLEGLSAALLRAVASRGPSCLEPDEVRAQIAAWTRRPEARQYYTKFVERLTGEYGELSGYE